MTHLDFIQLQLQARGEVQRRGGVAAGRRSFSRSGESGGRIQEQRLLHAGQSLVARPHDARRAAAAVAAAARRDQHREAGFKHQQQFVRVASRCVGDAVDRREVQRALTVRERPHRMHCRCSCA